MSSLTRIAFLPCIADNVDNKNGETKHPAMSPGANLVLVGISNLMVTSRYHRLQPLLPMMWQK